MSSKNVEPYLLPQLIYKKQTNMKRSRGVLVATSGKICKPAKRVAEQQVIKPSFADKRIAGNGLRSEYANMISRDVFIRIH